MRCPFVNAVVGRVVNFPFAAMWGRGLARAENSFCRSIFMQHNMGLCCIDGHGAWGGGEFSVG